MFKIILRSFFLCCISYLLLLGVMLFQLKGGQRDFSAKYLEKILSNQEVQVNISKIQASWDKKNQVINVVFSEVSRVAKLDGVILEALPEVNLAIPLKSLLPFTNSHKKITIYDAKINLNAALAGNIDQNNNLIRFLELEVALYNIKLHLLNTPSDWLLDSSFILRNKKFYVQNFFLRNNNQAQLKLQGLLGEQLADISMQISNLKIDDIYGIWPKYLFVEVNTFLTSAITDGYISSLDAKILYQQYKMHQNANELVIKGELKNLTLKAHEKLPIISQINAKINVDLNTINVEVLGAKIARSVMKRAKITLPTNLQHLELSGEVLGEISDLLHFVPDKQIEGVKNYGMNFANLQGSALTSVKKIIIPLKNNLSSEEITYDIVSEVSKLSWQIFPQLLLQQHEGITLSFNGQEFVMQGKVKINNHHSKIKWAGYVPENSTHDFTLDINTHFSADNPEKFLFEEYPLKSGRVVQDLAIFSKAGGTKAAIKTDLTEALLELKNLGFFKEHGKKLIFTANAHIADNLIKVSDINLAGEDVQIKGIALINQANFTLAKLKLDPIIFNKNNFNLHYAKEKDQATTVISGKMIDLSHSDISKFFDKASNSNSKINLKLDQILMKNNVTFSALDSYINCTKLFGCLNASFGALMNEKFKLQGVLVPKIANIATLKITSDNASLIAKAFDIYRDLDAGILEIKGTLHNQTAGAMTKIEGSLSIKDFAVTKTSIFSRIISLTSVPGLMNLASSGKINFNNMGFDFIAKASEIDLTNGKMSGNEMDMTIEGEVNLAKKQLNLKGAVIPGVFFLNKILSSTPIVGRILKGSNKDGIISLSYKVGGSFDKPVIDANPFSITPGFIKSIFSILEKPASKLVNEKSAK